jgi:hypothetical protein
MRPQCSCGAVRCGAVRCGAVRSPKSVAIRVVSHSYRSRARRSGWPTERRSSTHARRRRVRRRRSIWRHFATAQRDASEAQQAGTQRHSAWLEGRGRRATARRAVVAPVRLRNITAADVMAQDCTSCSWHAATNNGAMQQVRKLEETVQRLLAEVLTGSAQHSLLRRPQPMPRP